MDLRQQETRVKREWIRKKRNFQLVNYWVGYCSLRMHSHAMGQYNSKQLSKWEVCNCQFLLVSWFLGLILSHRVSISLCISKLNSLALLLASEEGWVPRHRASTEPLCGRRNLVMSTRVWLGGTGLWICCLLCFIQQNPCWIVTLITKELEMDMTYCITFKFCSI